jgi:hypothetical protein
MESDWGGIGRFDIRSEYPESKGVCSFFMDERGAAVAAADDDFDPRFARAAFCLLAHIVYESL